MRCTITTLQPINMDIFSFTQVQHGITTASTLTASHLSHNGDSDSLSIVDMVRYVIFTYGTDPSKVYMTGSSSGAIMANVLAGAYPDVFAAGSAVLGDVVCVPLRRRGS
jgi:poly(3-hydroxybutyrate) depolymerase